MARKLVIRNQNGCYIEYRLRPAVIVERIRVSDSNGADLGLAPLTNVDTYETVDAFIEDQKQFGDTIIFNQEGY